MTTLLKFDTELMEGVTIDTQADWNGAHFIFTISRPETELKDFKIYIGAYYRHLGDVINANVGQKVDLKVAPMKWEVGNRSGTRTCLVEVLNASR